MVKSAFIKTVIRMFKANKGRFIANLLIVLISVAISSGLACMPSAYEKSYCTNYTENDVPDVILKEKTGNGFNEDDIALVKEDQQVAQVLTLMSMDYEYQENIYRIYIMDVHSSLAGLKLEKGDFPSSTYDLKQSLPILCEKGNLNRKQYDLNEKVDFSMDLLSYLGFDNLSFTICGIVNSPLYNSVQKENAGLVDDNGNVIEDKYVDYILYLDASLLPETFSVDGVDYYLSDFLIQTDMYISYSFEKSYFSSSYQKKVEDKVNQLKRNFADDRIEGLTLEENVSYALYKNYQEKILKITYIFPFFFILVCALVNLITITRLIEDERALIGTYVSLGVEKRKIVFKYLLFTIISSVLGAVFGLAIGIPLIPSVVLPAYNSIFEMGALSLNLSCLYSYLCPVMIVFISILVTLYKSLVYLKESPASLMKTKAPKPGKKILLQYLPILWNHLSFRFKSSFRNIFRQKKNLILTTLSVIGSTLLVFLSFALLNISDALKSDDLYANVASSMGLISFVIIVFAVSMTVVVVYSLANMNIADRKRELATLKVLGYHDIECSFNTFREIMIISIFAVILGLPISALITAFVFAYLAFGSISDVQWWSYLLTTLIVLGTTLAVNWLLYPKIKKIDMNDSLKTLD